MRQLPLTSLVMFLCLMSGCASVSSTLLEEDAFNGGWTTKKNNGYPITLQVPTHLRVDIVENRFLLKEGDNQYTGFAQIGDDLLTRRNVRTQIEYQQEIFLVDLKRPAAGKLNYGVTFSPDQYIQQIASREADDTIQQSSAAVVRVANAIGGVPTNEAGPGLDPSLANLPGSEIVAAEQQTADVRPKSDAAPSFLADLNSIGGQPVETQHSVIATRSFDLNAPDLELQIEAFIAAWISQNGSEQQ